MTNTVPDKSVLNEPAISDEQSKAKPSSGRSSFNFVHVVVFLLILIPLNPLVMESLRNPNFSFEISLLGYLSMICGPVTPLLFDRHAEVNTVLILVTGTILGICVLIQICWQPSQIRFEMIRQILWAICWWIWFWGAFVAIGLQM